MGQLSNTPKVETPIRLARAKSFSLGLWFRALTVGGEKHMVDLTGATIRFVVRELKRRGHTEILNKTAVLTDPTVGVARVYFQATELDPPAREYEYTATLVTASGYSYTFLDGPWEIVDNADQNVANVYVADDPTDLVQVVLGHDNKVTVTVEKGLKGDQGDVGPQGQQGNVGPEGPQGVQGVPGADSTVPGPQGPAGPMGPRGFTGDQGIQGEVGNTGPQGQQGEQGEKGDLGYTPTVAGTDVALIGASITYMAGGEGAGVYETEQTSGTTGHNSQGAYPWANAFLGGRLRLLANFGVGGQTSLQILAQMDQVLALPTRPAWVIVGEAAINGINTGTEDADEIIDNLGQIIDICAVEGINVVLQTTGPSDVLTGTELNAIAKTNAWIRAQNARPGVVVADVEPRLINHLTGAPKANTTYDGTHWNNFGGLLGGLALADALRPYIGGNPDLASTNVADGQSITANPMMVGTTGTKAAGATGDVATSWHAAWGVGLVGTAALSKIAATDHIGGEWQRIQMNSAGQLLLQQTISSGFTVGDVYVLEGEFRTQDWVNITALTLMLFDSALRYRTDLHASLSPAALPSPGWGVFRTPRYTVPAGVTYLSANVAVTGSSGIVDVRRVRLRRVA